MPLFDAPDYFAKRSAATQAKIDAIESAKQEKLSSLQETTLQVNVQREALNKSWVGQLGLEPGSFTANRVNDAASLVSGAARMAGQVAALPDSIGSVLEREPLANSDIEAYNRYVSGKTVPGDVATVGRMVNGASVFDRIKASETQRTEARDTAKAFDLTGLVEQSNRKAFADDLGAAYQANSGEISTGWNQAKNGDVLSGVGNLAKGLGGLIFSTGAATLTNGAGVREYVLENAPQLLVGTAGAIGKGAMAASNVGYAMDIYQQGLENYAKANGGQLPAPEQMQKMALQAASLALAEQAGDVAMLGLSKVGGKAAKDASRNAFKSSLKAAGGGYLSEAPTEAYQTYTEGEITGKPASGEEIFVAGAIGGASGGGLTGGIRTISELTGSTSEQIAERAAKAKEEVAKKQDLSAAIASGDVSAYVDPKSTSYAPEKAVAALFGNSQKADATPEAKQTNFTKAESIVAELKSEREKLQLELDWTNPDKLQERLDAGRSGYSPELIAATEETIATLRATPADPNEVAALEAKAKGMDRKIQLSETILKNFNETTQDQPVDVEAEVTKLKDADPLVSQGAADTIINLSMKSPELVDRKLAASLVSDTTNNLTDGQRDYLRSFSEARIAENSLKTMDDVSKEIYFGSEKGKKGFQYTGLVKYRSNVAATLAAGNQKSADRELGLLTSFETSHQAKAKAASEAYSAFLKDGIPRRVERNQDGSWKVEQGLWESAAARVENGGLNIKEDSPKIVANTQTEATAISKTAAELKAAYAVKFGSGNTGGASNVQNVSQALEGIQSAETQLRSEASTQAGTVEGTAATGGGTAADVPADATTGTDAVAPTGAVAVTESKASGYATRTKRNVDAGDITIAFAMDHSTAGEKLTARLVKEAGKPLVKWTPGMKLSEFADQIIAALKATNGTAINVAGNGIYSWGNTSQADLNEKLFKVLGKVKAEYPALATIVSGGQTGADMAGVIAGKALGLKVDVHLPAGFVQRDANRQDYKNTQAGIEKQIADGAAALTKTTAAQNATETVKSSSVKNVDGASFVNREDLQDGTKDVEISLDYSFKVTPENILGLATKMFQIGEKNRAAGFATYFSGNYLRFIESYKSMVVLDAINDQYKGNRGDFRAETVEKELASLLSKTTAVSSTVAATQEAPSSAASTVETAQLQSTEETTTSSEAVVPETEEVAEPKGLAALQQKSTEGTPYVQRNLLADHLKQAGKRPLVMVKDFVTALKQQTAKVMDYLDVKEPTDKQKAAVQLLVRKVAEWGPVIKGSLVKGYWNKTEGKAKENEDFRYTDLMQFLIEGTNKDGLDLEENIKTAIVYAAMRATVDAGDNNKFNSSKDINAMFGRSDEHEVSEAEQRILANVGVRDNTWRNRAGQAAVQALGLKAADENTPLDLLPRLESAFGAYIQKLLMDRGIMVRETLSRKQMQELFPQPEGEQDTAPPSWQFMKLARDAEGNPVPAAQQILEGLQGTGNVLDKLFGVESLVQFPLLQAAEFKDKSQKGVNEGIPENLREAVNQKQQEAGYLREDSWAVLSALPEKAFLMMHGWVDIENTTIHAMDMLSVQAKNEGIEREYNRIKQFVSEVIQPAATEADSELGAVPFYPEMFVAKQQRVFQKTNGFNQQTSKMHRNVYRKGSWAVDIKVSDESAMNNFKLRVLEALGVKTDAQTNDRTLDQFEAAFDPELQSSAKGKEKAAALRDAVKTLQKIIYEGTSLSDAEVDALVDGVAMGGEKGLTLAALQDMAHYMQAMETKAEKFPVQFQGEIDGKTNGVIISQLLFGGAVSVEDMKNRMRRGGLFFEADVDENGNPATQFNSWKQEGNLDQYESLAKRLNEIAQLSLASEPQTYEAIEAFTKPLSTKDGQVAKEGRDFTKNPLTTLMFGSTLYSAVDKMGDKLIAQISKRIVDVVDGNTPSTMKQVLEDLNVLITRGGGEPINVNMTNAQALSSELSTKQIKAIKRAFHNSLGDAAKQAFEEEFGTYLQQRSIADEAANLTFALSNAVITGMREDYVKQLIAAEVLPANPKTGQPLRALTQKEEREFQKQVSKLIPRVHTAGSKKDGKQSSGIGLFKTTQTLSTNPVYQGKASFGTPFADTVGKTGRQGQSLEAFSSTLNSNERVQEEPGISTSSKQVHSFDSTVARGAETLLVAQDIETDNNHDALTSGLAGFNKVGQALNQSFYTELSQYSPMGELSASLNGMVQNIIGFAVQGEGNNLSPTAQKNLTAVLNELVKTYGMDAASALNLVIKNTADAAYRADKMKLETLADVVSVDQYTLEGGNYTPTETDRQAVKDQLAALSPEVKLGVFEAVDSLVTLMGDALTVPQARQTKTRGTNEFGDLGASSVRHNADLVSVFEKRGQLNVKQLVHVLRKKFPENTVNREILEKLVPLLNAGLVVKYITPDSTLADVLEKAKEPSRGWFVSKGGKQEIYVLGTQFKDSGLTPELLLHEALHAALSQVINRPQSADAKALVAELQTLLTEAKAIVASDVSLASFAPAVSSVDELVSWGLTNKDFQVKVLSKVRMQSRTTQNRLVSGMKAFVDAVASLLFRRPDKNQNHGVFVLVQNVSGLMAEAANTQPAADVNLSMASQVERINSFTTLQIHEALDTGAVDPAFQSQLANLLTGIVDALHGPFGAFAAALRETEAKTPVDAWAKAKELGVAPFGSSVLSHMAASEQEAFAIEQVEATVKAALDGNDAQAKIAYRELYNLYTEMYEKFSKDGSDFFKGDWAMATPSEKAHAKSQYDFVFDLKSDNGDRSDYLARFAALGLAHQGFNQMLQVTTESDVGKLRGKESFEQRLQRWFSNVLGFFRQRVTKTYAGQLADVKLQTLVGQLVDIEAKKRSLIQAKKGLINTGMVEDGARAITESIRTKLAEAADSEFLRKQKNTAVQVARSAVSTIANDRTEKYIEGMQRFYERNVQAQGSVFVSVLKELTGHKEKLQAAFRAVKKFEGDRKDQIAGWAKDARKAFGKKIAPESSASITAVVMRTGLHYLSDTMSLAEIERLVDNPVAQNAAIAELEAKLGHMKAEYVTQIKGLGYYKATELVKVKTLMMNSYLISRLAGTIYEKQITEAQANAAEPIIKQLVSLYALKYTSRTEQALAKQVFRDENARGESVGNGIDFVMKAQKALEQKAFERQFMNNPALMVHGFTPEILNPHTEFVVATETDGQALVDFGYKKGAKVSKDSADPDQSQKYIYVLKGAGLAPHVSGALQFQSDTAKGTKAHSGYMNVNTQDGLENAQTQARFDQKLGSKIETDPNWDPSQEASNYTAPLYNENGKVVNWRYMMNKQTKDDLLQRNNSFDRVLGVLGGTVFSKPKIKEQNRAVLEALKEIYKDDYALNAESYIEVGPKSNDPELRSFWERLPDQTKEDVRTVWGSDGIKLTTDSLDVVFGYRKLSLADPIRQSQKNKAKLEAGGALSEADKQSLIAQNFVLSVEWALSTYARIKLGKSQEEAERYAKRAAAYVTRSERAWQEIVREIKTIYVIKGVTSMINNNKSNLTQLLASGVSLSAIREHMPVALKSATAYMADSDELRELENQMATGYTQGNEAEIERRIVRLRDAIARNPAREMIEAGLMPSIVEDIGEADDPFSYKTELARKTERFTDKLNPKVKQVAKVVYMTRDGKLYKALHQATQISDFVARYTMYQHRIGREQNPLSKAAAIQEVSEAFVNYDIPMHRSIQFMDDMGLMMFTKYFLRMQKVLLKMGRENPARVLALAAAENYFDLSSIVLDSSALAKIGNNPFNIGAFGFPGALDDLATIKAAMAVLK